ncbi:hypothetical protein GCM10010912_09470 [Paenibacillus albidus]|uniref:Aromatic amino acid beta-eliminating lyase/threonine aldolase domain-containing protein n=1 Tax=Paenibacillus albidus TaxID=2041023 RepID=A0A917C348_9BACL|nr:beta-eliminating lyase-related protein [Paenibacillus albidus]GGF66587.1 hypothetical protein GCM10010912_09470 [Paenibacillus albidus]
MKEHLTLLEAFNETPNPVTGHGKREVSVLTAAFREIEDTLASDIYGTGKVIEEFEAKMAKVLGKEAAVFFPSGTMAQQIALRIWCDRQQLKRVAYHPLCHLEIHEQDGLKELHHIEPILLADKDRLIRLEDVVNLEQDISCLLLELPQREIGGQLPEYAELEAISSYCHKKGIKLHLDGARLLESLPYYGRTAAEVCGLFDSVYISVYKGIGGIAGAVLAGDKEVMEESKIWKRRHGGDLVSLYPYILTADYYFGLREQRMGQYYEEAKELAAYFNACPRVSTLPEVPVTNMFHVHFSLPQEQLEPLLITVYEETGIGLISSLRESGSGTCFNEVTIGDRYAALPKERLKEAFRLLQEGLSR